MIDYLISGITEDADFTLYTGTTPYNGTLYAHYDNAVSSVTILDVPNNFKFYAIFENDVTKFKTYKLIKTSSAYCDTGVCNAVFTLVATNVPTPTISITPTNTPTISLTPSFTPTPSVTPTNRILVTPTPTNSLTPTRTPTVTPTHTVTPSTSPTINCGYYRISYNNEDNFNQEFAPITYIDCSENSQTIFIHNLGSYYTCVLETSGVPEITITPGYEIYISVERISNCVST